MSLVYSWCRFRISRTICAASNVFFGAIIRHLSWRSNVDRPIPEFLIHGIEPLDLLEMYDVLEVPARQYIHPANDCRRDVHPIVAVVWGKDLAPLVRIRQFDNVSRHVNDICPILSQSLYFDRTSSGAGSTSAATTSDVMAR